MDLKVGRPSAGGSEVLRVPPRTDQVEARAVRERQPALTRVFLIRRAEKRADVVKLGRYDD